MPQYQMNRPGLLLSNGYVYVALGSTGCKGQAGFPKINNHGWVLGYNTLSLSETPYMFVTSPATNNAGVWQSGGGLATDSAGNIYLETADGVFDENDGGSDYGLSVLKLSPQLQLLEFFTPYNEGTLLEPNDLDLGSVGPLLLNPPGSDPIVIASGKAEEIYVLDSNNLGGFCSPNTCNTSTGNTNILQDVTPPSYLSGCLGSAPAYTCRYGTPTYWSNGSSNYVYFSELPGPLVSYSLNGTTLNTTPVKSPASYSGVGSGSISANSTGSGIYWAVTWTNGALGKDTGTLRAFDATNLQNQFYASSQAAGGRDALNYVPNFITPTVANGKVFVATESQLLVYGLLPTLTTNAGNNQSAYVGTTLPTTLSVVALSIYNNQPVQNIPITFTASPSGGSFSNSSAVTNSSGVATTTYKLPTKPETVTITVSSSKAVGSYFSETAVAGPAAEISLVSGGYQKGTVATTLTAPVVIAVKDPYNNLMPNAVVNFTDNNAGGTFNPSSATTNSSGQASSYYTLPTKASNLTLTATTGIFTTSTAEQSVAGSAASVNYVSGNNQSAQPNTQLTLPLVVSVTDQYGNPVSGVTVAFSDNNAGGKVSKSQVVTSSSGRASISYITPSVAGTVNITASVPGLQAFSFAVTVQ
jgi:protocatechuate 3,4-dioxygenase beta subunit